MCHLLLNARVYFVSVLTTFLGLSNRTDLLGALMSAAVFAVQLPISGMAAGCTSCIPVYRSGLDSPTV